jgi:hypothetical protein
MIEWPGGGRIFNACGCFSCRRTCIQATRRCANTRWWSIMVNVIVRWSSQLYVTPCILSLLATATGWFLISWVVLAMLSLSLFQSPLSFCDITSCYNFYGRCERAGPRWRYNRIKQMTYLAVWKMNENSITAVDLRRFNLSRPPPPPLVLLCRVCGKQTDENEDN